VAGAGPAGCAAAIGLVRLGYRVLLAHAPRPWPSCEAISARTLEGLGNAGLHRAAASVAAPGPRRVCWNGEDGSANTELLVLRQPFDAALLEDARAAGVELLAGRVRDIEADAGEGPRASIDLAAGGSRPVQCRLLVEARGRAAPAVATGQVRGPQTVSLLQVRRGPPRARGTEVTSFPDGWAWLAHTGEGVGYIQLSVTSDDARLPGRHELARWFDGQLGDIAPLTRWRRQTKAGSEVYARASTSILQGEVVGAGILRVGDAAMAVDPLSGNGIFQSLSSALLAPAVVNTLLRYPRDGALAAAFYRQRIRHTFLRFARTGRDFYRMETRWQQAGFWQQRQAWPDDEPAHAAVAPALLGIEQRPVVADNRICERPVAVTSEHPLGVWHVAGVELAPLLQNLPAAPAPRTHSLAARLGDACGGDAGRRGAVEAWLRRHGLL